MSEYNQCPHPTCLVNKPRNQYACYKHWMALPALLKRKIHSGYRSSAKKWLEADKEAQEFYANEVAKEVGE